MRNLYPESTKKLFTKSYLKAGIAILITVLVMFLFIIFPPATELMMSFMTITNSGFGSLIFIILWVLIISFAMRTMSTTESKGLQIFLFILIPTLFAFVLAPIMFIYSLTDLITAIAVTSIYFLLLFFFSLFTKIDFTKWTRIAMISLLSIIIVSVIAMFIQIPVLYLIISFATIVVFTVYTIIDNQNMIKYVNANHGHDKDEFSSISYYFGVNLYMDFVNLLINILNLFGNR